VDTLFPTKVRRADDYGEWAVVVPS